MIVVSAMRYLFSPGESRRSNVKIFAWRRGTPYLDLHVELPIPIPESRESRPYFDLNTQSQNWGQNSQSWGQKSQIWGQKTQNWGQKSYFFLQTFPKYVQNSKLFPKGSWVKMPQYLPQGPSRTLVFVVTTGDSSNSDLCGAQLGFFIWCNYRGTW